MSLRQCRTLQIAPLAFGLICLTANAQTAGDTTATPKQATAPANPCDPTRDEACPPEAVPADEKDRAVRNTGPASPQMASDAPLPAAGGPGGPPTSLRFERGPLKIRNYGLSVGLDHALSRQWLVGVLVNVAKGKLSRSQTEFATTSGSTTVVQSDTTVDTRSTSLAASLSYFTENAIAIDGTLAFMRTQLDTRRLTDGHNEFTGDNVGSNWGLWLNASRIYRFGPRAVVPQIGLEYVDSRTDPLEAKLIDLDAPGPATPGFRVGEQRQRTLASLVSLQLQQPMGMRFGTLTPYVRGTWRERLWKKSDTVIAENANALTRELDPDAIESRRSFAIATGVVAQFTKGISTFADLSYRRGTNDLRETRLALGVKFER